MGKTYTPIWFLPTVVNSEYRNNYDEIFSKKEGRQQKAGQAKGCGKKDSTKAESPHNTDTDDSDPRTG